MRKLGLKEKLSIPGIKTPELIEIQELLPNIRRNIAIISIILCTISQIRIKNNKVPVEIIKKFESVNHYIRNYLAKSEEVTYIAAGVAIRSTMMVYGGDDGESELQSDFYDLATNLTGRASTKFGLSSALSSPSKLRTYRRGLMLRVIGNLQTTPLYSPKQIIYNIESLVYEDLPEVLPFDTNDLNFNDILEVINNKLGSKEEPLIFDEFESYKVPMENNLYMKRNKIEIPNEKSIIMDKKELKEASIVKKLAYKQLKNIKNIKDDIL